MILRSRSLLWSHMQHSPKVQWKINFKIWKMWEAKCEKRLKQYIWNSNFLSILLLYIVLLNLFLLNYDSCVKIIFFQWPSFWKCFKVQKLHAQDKYAALNRFPIHFVTFYLKFEIILRRTLSKMHWAHVSETSKWN